MFTLLSITLSVSALFANLLVLIAFLYHKLRVLRVTAKLEELRITWSTFKMEDLEFLRFGFFAHDDRYFFFLIEMEIFYFLFLIQISVLYWEMALWHLWNFYLFICVCDVFLTVSSFFSFFFFFNCCNCECCCNLWT